MGDKVVIDKEVFGPRLKLLCTSWKEKKPNADAWGGAKSLCIITPPPTDDLRYYKSEALHVWLFGYQLTETLMLLTASELHVVASAKKGAIVKELSETAESSAGIKIVVHFRAKNDTGEDQMNAVLSAAKAAGPVIGGITKEEPEGAFGKLWASKLSKSGVEQIDVAAGLGDVLAVKDTGEILNVKKAAYMSVSVLKGYVLPEIESIIDQEKKVHHIKLSQNTEGMITQPSKVKVKLKAENLDICYPPIFQSGGTYDLRPTAGSNENHLSDDIIVVSLGARYLSYCSNIARTYLVDPTKKQQEVYKALLAAYKAALAKLVPGVRLSEVYEAAVKVLKDADESLVSHLTKNLGYGMGLEFKEGGLLIGPKNATVVRAGMVFNLSLGLQNLVNTEVKEGAKQRNYALLIADTVIVRSSADGAAEVATDACGKDAESVTYTINDGGEDEEDDEEEEKARREDKEVAASGRSSILPEKLRHEKEHKSAEALRKERQAELAKKQQEEGFRRYQAGQLGSDGNKHSTKEAVEATAYKNVDDVPHQQKDVSIQIDHRAEAVLLPIYGVLVPFHISTIKNVSAQLDGSHSFLRINFNVPTAGAVQNYAPALKYPDMIYLREVSYRSSDVRHANQIMQQLKAMQKQVKQRESEKAERATLVTQEKLQLSKGRVYRLPDLWIRPGFASRGRKLPGTLEVHQNGFRYSTGREGETVDISFRNIKHAFFQPAENEMITLLHFHLHDPIMVGKRKSKDVQFFTEVMEAVQAVEGGRRSMYDPDEIEEEQRERERRNKINAEFQAFVKRVNEVWERDYKELDMEFDIPFRELGFTGVPFKSTAFCIPTVNCLVELTEVPFLVITLGEIEVVNLERVGHMGLRNFDMAIVFKDLTKDVQVVAAIEMKFLDTVKEWLTSMSIKYYEGRVNLNWKQIMRTITENPEQFYVDGGWEFLNNEASDDEEAGSSEESDAYQPSDEEAEEESDEDVSEDESLVSSEDEYEDEEEEEEGKTWDELEAEAKRADKEKGVSDESDDDRRRKKAGRKGGSTRPPPPPPKRRK